MNLTFTPDFNCDSYIYYMNQAKILEDLIYEYVLVFTSVFILLMQLGFLLVVAGQVRKTNQLNNLSKIFFDIFITSISFYFIGYSFNTNAQGGFIGQGNVLTLGFESTAYVDWFFKFTLCQLSSTIVSGCLVERMHIDS